MGIKTITKILLAIFLTNQITLHLLIGWTMCEYVQLFCSKADYLCDKLMASLNTRELL